MTEPIRFPRKGERSGCMDILQELVAQVERGEIEEVMVIAKLSTGHWESFASYHEDRLAAIGELEVLKTRLIQTIRPEE